MFETESLDEHRVVVGRLPRVKWAELPAKRAIYRELLNKVPRQGSLEGTDEFATSMIERLGPQCLQPLKVLVKYVQQSGRRRHKLDLLSWRLAAGEDKLSAGKCINLGRLECSYWAACQIIDARQERDKYRFKDKIVVRLWSGDAAGSIAVGHFPERFHYYLARELDALVKHRRRTLYNHIRLINYNVCFAYVSGTATGLTLKGVRTTGAMRKYNKALSRSRFRQCEPCPFHLDHDCLSCHITRDICRSSVNPSK